MNLPRKEIPHRAEFLTTEAHRLAVAEYKHRQAMAARLWFWFRVGLALCSLPVCALWLYACAYL